MSMNAVAPFAAQPGYKGKYTISIITWKDSNMGQLGARTQSQAAWVQNLARPLWALNFGQVN